MWNSVLVFAIFALLGLSWGHVLFKDDGVSQTIPLKVHRKGILHLKSQILKILGLSEGPRNTTRDELASRFMSQLYELETDSTAPANFSSSIMEFLQKADVIVSFAPSKKLDFEEEEISELDFSLNDLPPRSRLINAELRLHLNSTDLLLDSITAYLRDDDSGDLRPLENLELFSSEDSQLALNITGVVDQWLQNASLPRSIFLQLLRSDGSRSSLSGGGAKWHGFGVASFEDSEDGSLFQNHVRAKRAYEVALDDHDEPTSLGNSFSDRPNPLKTGNYKGCRLHQLYVSFADLGWEQFVIAPDGFNAQYCDGFCSFPFNSRMNWTNHAIVQAVVNLIDSSRTEPAKCAPTEMKSMKILFFDHTNNVIMRRYRDIIVQSCGCQ
ncbi:hypothetical protein QR680_005616 [Steinernema hermaphroditum]|uniref:TGF-beta family profile domain-containing protein n=1 Tax=Steinernema hermaphroditum TaxID=289476 RepID=A0AA39LVP9_9BILA|nr:hypothetical protein QR680_005616 [Steinernema hermaphroditum]